MHDVSDFWLSGCRSARGWFNNKADEAEDTAEDVGNDLGAAARQAKDKLSNAGQYVADRLGLHSLREHPWEQIICSTALMHAPGAARKACGGQDVLDR